MHLRATLLATILGSSLAFIDGSVINVALPALASDLKVAPSALSWAINAYLLPLGALILLGLFSRIAAFIASGVYTKHILEMLEKRRQRWIRKFMGCF